MKSFVIFGTLILCLATLTAGQFSNKQYKCFQFRSNGNKETTTYDLARVRGNSCQVSITYVVENNFGDATSSTSQETQSCSYVPECFSQSSSNGGNRNNGGNQNTGGNRNNGGFQNNGGNRNNGGNQNQAPCQTIRVTLKNRVLQKMFFHDDGRGQYNPQGIYERSTDINGRPSWIQTAISEAIWYIPKFKKWAIGPLSGRGKEERGIAGYLRDAPSLPYETISWEYYNESNDEFVKESAIGDISVQCAAGSSGGGNRNNGGNLNNGGNRNNGGNQNNFGNQNNGGNRNKGGNQNNGGNRNNGGNQNNGGNSGGSCQVECKQSSCSVRTGGTLGSCFLPPFSAKCSGLPSGCGSCVNQCSKK